MLVVAKHPHTGARTAVAAFHTSCIGKFIEQST
jgi:hypothetical protein